MTTDKTPAALADEQDSGRVRLGDQAERARFEAWAGDFYHLQHMGEKYRSAITTEAWQAWQAALSAHPSPGGQDARDIIAEFVQCADAGRPPGQLLAQARDFLAARQPVGEPVACVRDLLPPEVLSAISACAVIAKKESAHPVQKYIDAINAWLYAAPPAHGVDLGPSQSVLAEVAQERARQETKWGQQNHVDWTPTSAATDLAGAWPAGVGDHFKFITDYKAKGTEGHRLGYFDILMEEVAEAHDEARDGNTKATRVELVQVAAVAVAWIECIDRRLATVDSEVVGNGN